jgi:hypothetical protein
VQQLEHVLGKYVISDKPMSEDEWVAAHATVIEVTPEKSEDEWVAAHATVIEVTPEKIGSDDAHVGNAHLPVTAEDRKGRRRPSYPRHRGRRLQAGAVIALP